MSKKREFARVNRLLAIVTGAVLVGAAFFLGTSSDGAVLVPLAQPTLVVVGCFFAVLGIVSRRGRVNAACGKASLVLLSIVFAVATAEAVFRLIGFDFNRFHQPGDAIPIYYRTPTIHAGEGVFRRCGPASWRGQPLRAYMRMHGTNEGPYTNEPIMSVQYDAFGFRNPSDLTDWEVVVTGDSFVELGFVPDEELFTTVVAKELGVRVKNLGVSGTGPIWQTFYVRNYGKAVSTRDAVLCFFEGNDLEDLRRELRNAESFRATGEPLEHRKQVSLLQELCARYDQFKRRGISAQEQAGVTPDAALVTTHPERAMTVYGHAPAWDQLNRSTQQSIVQALSDWAATARSQGMRPWVMYMPDSHRVFHGLIRYADTNSAIALWKPGDFAGHLGAACTNIGLGFIDTFPALRSEAEAGRVPYNLVGDTHLSREGSRVVGHVLADALKSKPSR